MYKTKNPSILFTDVNDNVIFELDEERLHIFDPKDTYKSWYCVSRKDAKELAKWIIKNLK